MGSLDVNEIRSRFPILSTKMRGKPLVYLDNGATTQKPQAVLDRLEEYYSKENANVHRGVYELSDVASKAYEAVREEIAELIGVKNEREIIYTRGTTEGLNIVAQCWARRNIGAGDIIAVTRMEHHSNFVPWQWVAKEKGASFEIVELDSDFRISDKSLNEILEKKPKVLALSFISNVTGAVTDLARIAQRAHEAGALVVVDAAQAVGHLPLVLSELGPIDFMAFSSHKMYGPTGAGVLWGKMARVEEMSPWQYGGDMISNVQDQTTEWNEIPVRFEAGTPNIAGIIGMGAAAKYLKTIGMKQISGYEEALTRYTLSRLTEVEGLRLIGPKGPEQRAPIFSFVLEKIHPHDLATFLDSHGIAVRAGHHCAQPLVNKFGLTATTRASLSFYNTKNEVDQLIDGIEEAKKFFRGGVKK